MMLKSIKTLNKFFIFITILLLSGCFGNNPYSDESAKSDEKVLYMSYQAELPFFDIANAYNVTYNTINSSICEPLFEYHYLKRPAELKTLTAKKMPTIIKYDKDGKVLPEGSSNNLITKMEYIIEIKQGIKFQDHPCFAKDKDGNYIFHLKGEDTYKDVENPYELLSDSRIVEKTRELTAADFVYQYKRLANPMNKCPIAGVLDKNILGFDKLKKQIGNSIDQERAKRKKDAGLSYNQSRDEQDNPIHVDLREFNCEGIKVIDKYKFKVTLKSYYPQMLYWMAMNFFAPMPWEVQRFYRQHASAKAMFSLNNFPVGTGPYKITENKSNYRIVLEKNSNFRKQLYPSVGAKGDREKGLLDAAGKELPFIDKVIYMLDREGPPRWTKFIQGYYDLIELQNSDRDLSKQVMELTDQGGQGVSPEMAEKGIQLSTTQKPFIRYYAFNMADPVFGGLEEEKCKLRQAITIALDVEQQIKIFHNGRGKIAQAVIPSSLVDIPEKEFLNPYIYKWNEEKQKAESLGIEHAKKLMQEAGYANGKDKDGNQLILNYDTVGGRGVKTKRDWINKQLNPIGVKVEMRETDNNRWKEKLSQGSFQFIDYGWFADYPDPENFAFLLYGPNGRAKFGGENYANYNSPEYDKLFKQMETMTSGPERNKIIKKMLDVSRREAPWIFAYEPSSFAVNHSWLKNYKTRMIGGRVFKYLDIDIKERKEKLAKWNKTIAWPVYLVFGLALLLIIGSWYRLKVKNAKGMNL